MLSLVSAPQTIPDVMPSTLPFSPAGLEPDPLTVGLQLCKVVPHLQKVPAHLWKVGPHLLNIPAHLWKVGSHLLNIPAHLWKVGTHLLNIPAHLWKVGGPIGGVKLLLHRLAHDPQLFDRRLP